VALDRPLADRLAQVAALGSVLAEGGSLEVTETTDLPLPIPRTQHRLPVGTLPVVAAGNGHLVSGPAPLLEDWRTICGIGTATVRLKLGLGTIGNGLGLLRPLFGRKTRRAGQARIVSLVADSHPIVGLAVTIGVREVLI